MNANYNNKRIALVVLDNKMQEAAKETEKRLRAEGAEPVIFSDFANYPNHYALAQFKPQMTVFLEKVNEKIVPCKVMDVTERKNRDRSESTKAVKCFMHPLRMNGAEPKTAGAYTLDWEEVKHFEWYWQDKAPMIYLSTKLPAEKVADVMMQGIKEYFNQKRNEPAPKEDCTNCGKIKGSADR